LASQWESAVPPDTAANSGVAIVTGAARTFAGVKAVATIKIDTVEVVTVTDTDTVITWALRLLTDTVEHTLGFGVVVSIAAAETRTALSMILRLIDPMVLLARSYPPPIPPVVAGHIPYPPPQPPQIVHIHHGTPQLPHQSPYVTAAPQGSIINYRPGTPANGQLPLPRPGSGYFAPDPQENYAPQSTYGHHSRRSEGSFTGSLSRQPRHHPSYTQSPAASQAAYGSYPPRRTQSRTGESNYYRPSSAASVNSQREARDLDELDRERRVRREHQRQVSDLERYAQESGYQAGRNVHRSLSTH